MGVWAPGLDKSRISYAMVLVDGTRGRKENEDEGGSDIGAKLEACFYWSPAFGEEKRRRLIHDMNRICTRIDEDHLRFYEFHLAMQELETLQYDIDVSCGWTWCFGLHHQQN